MRSDAALQLAALTLAPEGAVHPRRHAERTLEQIDEMAGVVEADLVGDLVDRQVCRAQKLLGVVDALHDDILVRRVAGAAFEQADKVIFIDAEHMAEPVERKILAEMLRDIVAGLYDELRRGVEALLHGGADAGDQNAGDRTGGLNVTHDVGALLGIGGQKPLELRLHLRVARKRDDGRALVLQHEQLVIPRARFAPEVHPEHVPVAGVWRCIVVLLLLAVDPEHVVGAQGIAAVAVFQNALAADGVFEQIGNERVPLRVKAG